MMKKNAGKILANEIRHAIDSLKSCITPIFDVNDKGEAEHVIDAHVKLTLYIDGPKKMEPLEGGFYGPWCSAR
jgi:hypothetical protein